MHHNMKNPILLLCTVVLALLPLACSSGDLTPTPEVTGSAPTETAAALTPPPTAESTATPGIPPTDTPHTTFTIVVPGDYNGWIDTGIWLQAGDVYEVQASGVLNIWPNCAETKAQAGYPDLDCADVTHVEPPGTMAFGPTLATYPYPGGPTSALVGRVDSAPSYLTGNGGTFTAETSGFLKFTTNEIVYMEDNQGQFSVLVTIPYAMPPASLHGEWFATGLVLAPGESVTITVTGAIDMWPNCEETRAERGYPNIDCATLHALGPGGTALLPPQPGDEYPLPEANTMALVGRFGNGAAFLIGAGGTFTAEGGGPLLLAVNDTAYWRQDDIGAFNVAITSQDGTLTYLDVH